MPDDTTQRYISQWWNRSFAADRVSEYISETSNFEPIFMATDIERVQLKKNSLTLRNSFVGLFSFVYFNIITRLYKHEIISLKTINRCKQFIKRRNTYERCNHWRWSCGVVGYYD